MNGLKKGIKEAEDRIAAADAAPKLADVRAVQSLRRSMGIALCRLVCVGPLWEGLSASDIGTLGVVQYDTSPLLQECVCAFVCTCLGVPHEVACKRVDLCACRLASASIVIVTPAAGPPGFALSSPCVSRKCLIVLMCGMRGCAGVCVAR
jgi:hypothetical protein